MDRRRVLLSAAVCATAGCATAERFAPDGSGWRTRSGGSRNRNHSATSPPADDPRLAWRVTDAFDADTLGVDYRFGEPAPAIVAGRAVIGGSRLTGFDAATGRELWATDLPTTGLAATDERVYAIGRPDGSTARLVACDAETGAPIWRRAIGRTPSAPLLTPAGVVTTSGDGYSAFDSDGRLLWHVEVDTEHVFPPVPPAASSRALYLPGTNALGRYDRATGVFERSPSQRWTTDDRLTTTQRYAPPTVTDETVLVPVSHPVPSDGQPGIRAYDTAGAVRWRLPAPTAVSTPAVADGVGYAVRSQTEWTERDGARRATAGDAELVSFRVATGSVRWRAAYPGFGFGAFAPVVADGRVYAILRDEPNERGRLAAHTTSGRQLWTHSLPERPSHLAAANRSLFVTLFDGSVLVFRG